MAVTAISLTEYLFISEERHRLIDQQIERSASLLVASNLSKAQLNTIEEAEDIVFDVLEEDPPNQIIQLFNEKNELIYANDLAKLILQEFRLEPGWQTIKEKGHRFRILTVLLPEKQRTLQIGLVLDRYDNLWRSAYQSVVLFAILIFIVVSVFSYFLMKILMSPLKKLAEYLTYLGTQVSTTGLISTQSEFENLAILNTNNKDEFGELINSVQNLKNELKKSLIENKFLSAQMAHELKTPLTILKNILEKNYHSKEINNSTFKSMTVEITNLEKIISEFLNWSYLETNPLPSEIHAIKLGVFINELLMTLSEDQRKLLNLQIENDFTVFCKPSLLKQLILNLISNSIKYSSNSANLVSITVTAYELILNDNGPGIPNEVLQNLGRPFNKGPITEERGTGLGLAWVHTICSKYNWKLEIKSSSSGTHVLIQFPNS